MEIRPLTNAAFIEGFDISKHLQAPFIDALNQAVANYAVLVFRDQDITAEEHMRFGRVFGELEDYTILRDDEKPPDHNPYLAKISNVDRQGELIDVSSRRSRFSDGNSLWHTDISYLPEPPSLSILLAREAVPAQAGGETEFADMRAAYDALSEVDKALCTGLRARHSLLYSRSKIGFTDFNEEEKRRYHPVTHPLVRMHPVSGRHALYMGSHAGFIESMDENEGVALLNRLQAHATRTEFVYRHRWRPGDMVLWDNRATLHRARPYNKTKYRRSMQRVTVKGSVPVAAR